MITSTRNSFASPAFNTTAPATTPATGNPSAAVAAPPKGKAEPSAPRTLPTNSKVMGRDEFLKLFVAQLKNQDPTNPMDGKDMAAQLAQFSTVEQLIAMNKRADELAPLVEGQMAMAAVGKIGVTPGNSTFVDSTGKGTIVVDTGAKVGPGRVTVTNSKGEVVGTANVTVNKTGQQSFELGSLFTAPPLAAGQYSYKFEVATDGGQFQAVTTYTAGRITGMRYEQGTPILTIGDSINVPMSKLTQIRG
ncbi:flagellar hook assembly protein FlgD [Gemmatimonas sp.]|uniref:flagellar hook assembly protein FlgD n=1 Tax=Gemmatimonas sp. TaxID=1962908 RepID=UPI0031C77AF0|nr:hypothetical protein [Gemmatimonas sp.]